MKRLTITKYFLIFISFVILISSIFLVSGNWVDTDFGNRQQLTIGQSSGGEIKNISILVNTNSSYKYLDTASLIARGLMNESCSDMQFYNGTHRLTFEFAAHSDPIYGCNTNSTIIWLDLESDIPIGGITSDHEFYMYFNNTNSSSHFGNNTFDTWSDSYMLVLHFENSTNSSTDASWDFITNYSISYNNSEGIVGRYLNFSSSGTILKYRSIYNDSQNVTNEFTFSSWIKPTGISAGGSTIFDTGSRIVDGGDAISISICDSVQCPSLTGESSVYKISCIADNGTTSAQYTREITSTIFLNEWSHISCEWNSTSFVNLYVNGTLVNSTYRTGNLIESQPAADSEQKDVIAIGIGLTCPQGEVDNCNSGSRYSGYMDEVKFLNRSVGSEWVKKEFELFSSILSNVQSPNSAPTFNTNKTNPSPVKYTDKFNVEINISDIDADAVSQALFTVVMPNNSYALLENGSIFSNINGTILEFINNNSIFNSSFSVINKTFCNSPTTDCIGIWNWNVTVADNNSNSNILLGTFIVNDSEIPIVDIITPLNDTTLESESGASFYDLFVETNITDIVELNTCWYRLTSDFSNPEVDNTTFTCSDNNFTASNLTVYAGTPQWRLHVCSNDTNNNLGCLSYSFKIEESSTDPPSVGGGGGGGGGGSIGPGPPAQCQRGDSLWILNPSSWNLISPPNSITGESFSVSSNTEIDLSFICSDTNQTMGICDKVNLTTDKITLPDNLLIEEQIGFEIDLTDTEFKKGDVVSFTILSSDGVSCELGLGVKVQISNIGLLLNIRLLFDKFIGSFEIVEDVFFPIWIVTLIAGVVSFFLSLLIISRKNSLRHFLSFIIGLIILILVLIMLPNPT